MWRKIACARWKLLFKFSLSLGWRSCEYFSFYHNNQFLLDNNKNCIFLFCYCRTLQNFYILYFFLQKIYFALVIPQRQITVEIQEQFPFLRNENAACLLNKRGAHDISRFYSAAAQPKRVLYEMEISPFPDITPNIQFDSCLPNKRKRKTSVLLHRNNRTSRAIDRISN